MARSHLQINVDATQLRRAAEAYKAFADSMAAAAADLIDALAVVPMGTRPSEPDIEAVARVLHRQRRYHPFQIHMFADDPSCDRCLLEAHEVVDAALEKEADDEY